MTLTYLNPEQCPCCGRIDRILVARIADGTINTHTTGTITGSGVGIGNGGIGVGVGFGRVDLDSISQSRLQTSSERVALSTPDYTKNTIYGIVIVVLLALMFKCSTSILTTSITSQNNNSAIMNEASNGIAGMMPIMMVLFGITVGAVLLMKFVSIPKNLKKDEQIAEQNEKIAEYLENYYRTLRYCDNCHVIFDKAGYATFVTAGAIEKLSRNAGMFDLKEIENNRMVNMLI